MKVTTKLLAASLVLTAASGAFASEGDANADNAWLQQTAISQKGQQAPAPVAAAGTRTVNSNSQTVTP
jgi:hypothetical protein